MNYTSIIICVADATYLPEKKTPWAVCRDLRISTDILIEPGKVILAPTGVKIACPEGRHTKIYARSWLPIKSGLILANWVWVIDNDYRGEYFLQLYNFTDAPVMHTAWTRLGQIEIVPYFIPEHSTSLHMPPLHHIIDADIFADFEHHYPTQRGAWWFHSTGK